MLGSDVNDMTVLVKFNFDMTQSRTKLFKTNNTSISGMRPQLFLLYSLIIHSSINLFSQHSRQFILSFFQVFEA